VGADLAQGSVRGAACCGAVTITWWAREKNAADFVDGFVGMAP